MLASFIGALAAYAMLTPQTFPTEPQLYSQTPLELFTHTLPVAKILPRQRQPVKRRVESAGLKINAPSAFVADVASGKVLFAKDPHRILPIASLTKLVTAMVFLDLKPDLKRTLTLTEEDFDRESKTVFPPDETFTLDEVLTSMLVGSVNTSANALARISLGKERFVAAMNAKVQQLGLRTPILVEPSGVDTRNRASAADVAALLSFASNYPKIIDSMQASEFTLHGLKSGRTFTLKATNLLLASYLHQKPYHIVAAKTGSLPEAGFCMAQVTRHANGQAVVVVELGNANHFSRFQDVQALTAWAFDTYEWK